MSQVRCFSARERRERSKDAIRPIKPNLADTEWLSWSGGIENNEDHVMNATPGSGSSMRRQLGDSVKGTAPMILSITPLQSIKLIALKLEELINRDGKNCCRRGVKNAPARFQRPAYQKCADAIARKALNIIMKPNPKTDSPLLRRHGGKARAKKLSKKRRSEIAAMGGKSTA